MRRLLLLCLMSLVVLSGCGQDDATRLQDRAEKIRDNAQDLQAQVQDQTKKARAEARRVGKDLSKKVRQALEDLQRTVPRAGPLTQPPSSQGQTDTATIDAFLTKTLKSVDAYWTTTFRENGQPEPTVRYLWVPVGESTQTGCGSDADDTAAFYCPSDDTIYVGRRIAAGVYDGVVEGFPGQQAGYGRAVGDFGVAYLIAHEYAHNIQQELGFFSAERRGSSAKPFELQADCMAGVWGASVYRAGLLKPGDVQEALSTALAVGDFEYGSEQHHGTPQERRDAWQLGFSSGEPSSCREFVRA